MLSFGLIIDEVFDIPKNLNDANFDKLFKKSLFNYFFKLIDNGGTKFYTTYQNKYSIYAVQVIEYISDITNLYIDIVLIFENEFFYDKALEYTKSINYKFRDTTQVSILSSDSKDNNKNMATSTITKFETSNNLIKFNIYMDIVKECSTVIFFSSDKLIPQNSQVSNIKSFCNSYSIDYINIFDSIF